MEGRGVRSSHSPPPSCTWPFARGRNLPSDMILCYGLCLLRHDIALWTVCPQASYHTMDSLSASCISCYGVCLQASYHAMDSVCKLHITLWTVCHNASYDATDSLFSGLISHYGQSVLCLDITLWTATYSHG
ncbi:hypothetical protein GDO81_001154 [Engystomops pustulosus]|uniref:Uncharacterized protein n=1 Tax=Engystomops pustulosus TaxID=76066 RepID=A0AAV7DCI2_ENGPU|nr:hypothetical protein GDO81_001154 [Engystomops pustulosus]